MSFSNSLLLHVAVERFRVRQVAPRKNHTRRSGCELIAELADLFDFLASLIVFEKHHPSRILHALKDGPGVRRQGTEMRLPWAKMAEAIRGEPLATFARPPAHLRSATAVN